MRILPRDQLADLFAELAGVACVWTEDPQPQLGLDGGPQAWIELSLLGTRPQGVDEYRQATNANNAQALTSTIVGNRSVTISVKARSYDKDTQAYDLLERVRARLGSRLAQSFFLTWNLAPRRAHPIAAYGRDVDDRTRLEATMDVELGLRVAETDNTDDGITIATASTVTPAVS